MAEEREIQKCGRHPGASAVARCVTCGEALCEACATVVAGKYYCRRDAAAAQAEPPPARPRSGRVRPGYVAAVAALVLAGWGILFALRPVMEYGAGVYREELTRRRLAEVAAAADAFKADMGRYPTQEEGLVALVEEPEGSGRWFGPYLPDTFVGDGAVVDAAARPLGYRVAAHEHVLIAPGEDGVVGTADDVELRLEGRAQAEAPAAFPSWWSFVQGGGRAPRR